MTMRIDTSNEISKDKTSCLKIVLKSKIMYLYLIYTLIGTTAMSTALGLKMLTLTNYYNSNILVNFYIYSI